MTRCLRSSRPVADTAFGSRGDQPVLAGSVYDSSLHCLPLSQFHVAAIFRPLNVTQIAECLPVCGKMDERAAPPSSVASAWGRMKWRFLLLVAVWNSELNKGEELTQFAEYSLSCDYMTCVICARLCPFHVIHIFTQKQKTYNLLFKLLNYIVAWSFISAVKFWIWRIWHWQHWPHGIISWPPYKTFCL